MTQHSIKELIKELYTRQPHSEFNYYSITFICREDGSMQWSCYSEWDGFADNERKIELRKASLVKADRMVIFWRERGLDCAVINNRDEMTLFFLMGGHGLIKKEVAETTLPETLKSTPTVQTGEFGFDCVHDLPEAIFNKDTTPKQRMRILKRDDYRCKICGRRSTDNVDLQLHVHHIRPWAKRGLTEDKNLITLCHTCHNGLDPHYELNLFELLIPGGKNRSNHFRDKFRQGVLTYRKKMFEKLNETDSK